MGVKEDMEFKSLDQTVKVLECPDFVPFLADELEETYPTYNRDGFYYDRISGSCWYECGGKAYLAKEDYFLEKLEQLNHKPLRECERKAIESLWGLDNSKYKPLRELLERDDFLLELRRVRLNAWAARRQILGF